MCSLDWLFVRKTILDDRLETDVYLLMKPADLLRKLQIRLEILGFKFESAV